MPFDTLSRIAVHSVIGLGLTAPLSPQNQVRTLPFATQPAGGYTLADSGDYTHDQRISVACVAGGEVFVLFDPSLHTGRFATGVSQATGLVTWPGYGAVADSVIVTCANSAAVVTKGAGYTFSGAPTLNAAWHGATGLHARRLGTTNHLAGVASNGATILLASQNDGGTIVGGVSIGVSSVVKQVALLDWNHDGVLEVAAMTATALGVYGLNGQLLAVRPVVSGGTFLGMAATRDPNGDRVAMVYYSGLAHYVVVSDQALTDTPILFDTALVLPPQTPMTFHGLRASLLPGDAFGDFLVAHAADSALLIKRTGTAVTQHAFTLTPASTNPAANTCVPIWRDLNNDLAPDGVFLRNVPKEVKVVDAVTDVLWSQSNPDVLEGGPHEYKPADNRKLTLKFKTSFLTAQVNAVRATMWHRDMSTGKLTEWGDKQMCTVVDGQIITIQLPDSMIEWIAPIDGKPTWPFGDQIWMDLQRLSGSTMVGSSVCLPLTLRPSSSPPAGYLSSSIGFLPNDPPNGNIIVRPVLVGGILPRHATPPPL
jgi:hypothetical protein